MSASRSHPKRCWCASIFILLGLHGMMLLMVLIGLLLGWRLGEPGLAWYGAYVFCMAIRGLAANGLLVSLLLPEHPQFSGRLSAIAICFSFVAASRLVVHIFNLKQHAPRLAQAILAAGLIGVPGMVLALAGHYGLIAPLLHGFSLVARWKLPWRIRARGCRWMSRRRFSSVTTARPARSTIAVSASGCISSSVSSRSTAAPCGWMPAIAKVPVS